MQERLQFIAVALIASAIVLFIAWLYGYFSLPPQEKKREKRLSFLSLFFIFALYFLVVLIIAPLLGFAWLFFLKGLQPTHETVATNIPFHGWLSVSTLCTAALLVTWYSLSLKPAQIQLVWNRAQHKIEELFKDASIGIITWIISYPLVLAVGQVVILLVLFISQQPPHSIDQVAVKYLKTLLNHPFLFWMTAAIVAIVVPIAEELLFRGFLQTWLRHWLGRGWAIITASLVFAFMHFSMQQGIANWELLTSLFVLSCFLGFIYERQRSLWAPIGLHITFNTLSILLILIKLQYNN